MNRRVTMPAIAAAGIGLLAYFGPRAHPANAWNIRCDREMSQVKAREFSSSLGVDTSGWTAVVTGTTSEKSGVTVSAGSEGSGVRATVTTADESISGDRRFTPIFPKVALVSPSNRADRILVTLSAGGEVNRWERRGFQNAKTLDLDAARRISAAALDRFTGKDAGEFRPAPGNPENEGSLTIAFERGGPKPERFEATLNGSQMVRAELKPVYSRNFDRAVKNRKKYVEWLGGAAAVVVYFLGSVWAFGAYVFWAVRRAVRYRFVLPLAAGTLAIWGGVYWLNWMSYDARYDAIASHGSILGEFWPGLLGLVFLILYYFILTGATDAICPRPKLATLRSIFTPSALNRQTGASIWYGMLCAPLLAALPLAISAMRLFGSERLGDYNAGLIYAAHPSIQALDVPLNAGLLGLFGFGAAQSARIFRKKWLATAALAICGILLLASNAEPSESGPVAFLLIGAALFAGFHQIFQRFDLLAVLAAGWGAQVLWNATALVLQPAQSMRVAGVSAYSLLALLAACAGLVAWRGQKAALEEAPAPEAVTSQREALMKEFSIAHRVQQQMLPERPPEIPGCTVAASCHPAQEVGGDLFEFLQLPDGRWTIGVGDVSGKGVHAALYMTLTKGLLMATTQDSSDLADIIGHVNRHVHAATERKTFVTMALGAFDPETRTFDHVRAGHNPVVWRRAADGATSLLNAPGLGLGIVGDRLFRRSIQPQRLQLGAGDALVFYSDGVTEAMNADREQFGEERLMRSVEDADGLDAGGVREHIVRRVKEFLNGIPPQDDMTVVVLRLH